MRERKPKRQGDEAAVVEITDEAIARRAYEISESDESGTPEENWVRAECELREAQLEATGAW